MALMYDSATDQIPADAQEILVYTDGAFENDVALKAQFPNAKIHTISAVGKNLGEFIDCEPGCVWPVAKAVQVFRVWGPQGCKGFYCSKSTRPLLETALRAVQIDPANVEWFEADPTGIDHILNDDVATQFQWAGVYDVSETSSVLDPPPPPPPPPPSKEIDMILIRNSEGSMSTFDGAHKVGIVHSTDAAALEAAGIPAVQVSDDFYAAIPLAH